MNGRLDRTLSICLTLSAVSMAIAVVHREFVAGPKASRATPARAGPPTYLAAWPSFARSGVELGDPSAAVKIVELADLECPFCRQFHARMATLRSRFGSKVSVVFVHYPIGTHRFARPAARAAECAAAEGRFPEFVEAIFKKQDSLGLKSWRSYAADAGLRRIEQFERCAADTATVSRIEEGYALGRKIKIRGTPTIIVNGWLFESVPDDSILTRVVEDLLAGKRPSVASGDG